MARVSVEVRGVEQKKKKRLVEKIKVLVEKVASDRRRKRRTPAKKTK